MDSASDRLPFAFINCFFVAVAKVLGITTSFKAFLAEDLSPFANSEGSSTVAAVDSVEEGRRVAKLSINELDFQTRKRS